jgi:hypothetical protein
MPNQPPGLTLAVFRVTNNTNLHFRPAHRARDRVPGLDHDHDYEQEYESEVFSIQGPAKAGGP